MIKKGSAFVVVGCLCMVASLMSAVAFHFWVASFPGFLGVVAFWLALGGLSNNGVLSK